MTTPVKTQCPNCQATYPIPTQHLDNADIQAKCAQCQTVFKVNQHRIKPVTDELSLDLDLSTNTQDAPLESSVTAASPASAVDKQPANAAATELGDLSGTSVDEMSQWLEEQMEGLHPATDAGSKNTEDTQSILDSLPSEQTQALSSTAHPSNLAAQDTNLNDSLLNKSATPQSSSNGDDAWVDDLLGNVEENTPSIAGTGLKATKQEPNLSNADLGNLLSEYGVDSEAVKEETPEERLAKMRSRIEHTQPTSQQIAMKKSPVVGVLWVIGCILMLLLMLTQYTIFNSNELLKKPKYAKTLHGVCKSLSCKLPAADPEKFVTSVRHRPSQVKDPSTHSDVIGGMVNLNEVDQLFPSLKVTLYQADQVVGGFVAAPNDYLIAPQQVLGSKQPKIFMFTIPVVDSAYDTVKVDSFY